MANHSPSSTQLQNTDDLHLDNSESVLQSTLDELSYLLIPPSQLTIMDSSKIGLGGYGEVFLATLDKLPQPPSMVAIKELRTAGTRGVPRRLALRLARELKIWAKANHPHVLQLVGYYLSDDYKIARLISPFMTNGNVSQYLRESGAGISKRLDIIRGITLGMDYLHSLNPPICHGDLKPTNVLVNDEIEAVLCDFGLASLIEESNNSSGLTTSLSIKGAIRYMSPELHLDEDAKHTLQSDTWAWGCTAFEILTDKPPFHQRERETGVLYSIIHLEAPGQLDMLLGLVRDAPKPEDAYTLRKLHSYLPRCWAYESRKRPPISLLWQQAFVFSPEDNVGGSDVGGSVVWTSLEKLAHFLIPPGCRRIDERSELGEGNYGEVVLGMPVDRKAELERSMAAFKLIEEDPVRSRKSVKILLLGSGESGKSTIVKQMKIIHQNGYTPDELAVFRPVVYKNLVDSAKDIVLAMKKIGVDCVDGINRTHAAQILDYEVNPDASFRLSPDIANAIDSLWKDPIIATVMDHSSEFYLMDSASYFFSHVQRIAQRDYIPNGSDVLRARAKTTGISETRFNLGALSIRMFDVGGQRPERTTWISCFDDVTSIIFCVALSEYDQVLLEEKEQNRMVESLVLFDSVINSRWFLKTSIILFLNKIDVFKTKLPKVPLERYFPEYAGGPDINKGAKYILWRFIQANRARLSIYPHLTQATDTSNIRLVFAAIKETILQNALRDSGII